MREIFFNSFKERILRGEIPTEFELSGAPVTSKFFDAYDNSDITIEQYRNLADFDTYHSGNSATIPSLSETLFEYSSYGVEYSSYEPDDISEKPLFVNSANSAEFYRLYDFDLTSATRDFTLETISDSAGANYNYGFYYAMKKSHLNWLAKRCNDEYDFNNQIRIVLGDDIGNLNDQDTLESMFCPTPDRPFQGVFDMNGHKIVNKTFLCKNNSNGLFGYLGKNGVVCNGIVEDIRMVCQKPITLDKIRDDCSDVVCGFLVGTNYGTVHDIVTSGTMQFDGFCPDVYLVNNKYEYVEGDNTFKNSAYNCFYPNKFCINSIYNVLPYAGYFTEGADSYYNDIGIPSVLHANTDISTNSLCSLGYLMHFGYSNFNEYFLNFKHFYETKCSIHDGFDQTWANPTEDIPFVSNIDRASLRGASIAKGGKEKLDWIYGYVLQNITADEKILDLEQWATFAPVISTESNTTLIDAMSKNTIQNLKKWKSFDGSSEYDIKDLDKNYGYYYVNRASYLCRQLIDTVKSITAFNSERTTPHQRLNPNARIAYYCSPIVGNNFGTIHTIDCKHRIKESSDTFVGFIGNVCGKQNCGNILLVNSVLDIEPNSGCKLTHKNYIKTKDYAPKYPEDWGNLYSVFGYNWDYCQSPYGVDEEEYSANSAECVRVTESYYDFNDFISSGDDFVPSGVNPAAFNRYIFNRYENKDSAYGNCNFAVNNSSTVDTIGSEIPDEIRSAKMKFKFTGDNEPSGFYIGFNIHSATYYGRIKFYDPYNEDKKSNFECELGMGQIAQLIASELDCDIQHFDLNYLGDAAKTLASSDDIGGLKKHGDYQLTLEDVLDYSPAFNGPCGRTENNARSFCRNIMNAKIAMGGELLANSAVCTSGKFAWQDFPFGGNNLGPFGTTNSKEDYDTRYEDGLFVIPSGIGPNQTDEDWNIFADDDGKNGPDMCCYMPPASRKYEKDDGKNGPEAFNSRILGYSESGSNVKYYLNNYKNNMNWFCSIQPEGKWDIVANIDSIGKDDSIYKRTFNPAIHRSMVTIVPRQNAAQMKNVKLAVTNLANTAGFLKNYGVTTQAGSQIPQYFGEDWTARIEEIKIPLMNRTQNPVYMSPSFEGLSDTSGVYIHAERGGDGFEVRNNDVVPNWKNCINNIGNLESMFVSISMISNVDGRKRVYPITVEIPLADLYIPISCISAGDVNEVTCSECTLDLANFQELDDQYNTVKVRDVSYYPLVPAYNVEDTNNVLIDYPLKSIYNIGAIAGMINHSEIHLGNGSHWDSFYNEEGRRQRSGSGYNMAICGTLRDIQVSYRDGAIDFINSLMTCSADIDNEGDISAENDRTIAVANKFSLIAPIYEYHQNEMGTSIECCDFYTDSLQRIPGAQFTSFINIELVGTERWPLSVASSRVFKPFIEWCNISNILDYTNFFEKRIWTELDDQTFYIPFQDSNFPEMPQILWDTTCMTGKDKYSQVIYGGEGSPMDRNSWPVYSETSYPPPDPDQHLDQMIELEDLPDLTKSIRRSRTKTYHYLPNYLLHVFNLKISDSGTSREYPAKVVLHMSPAADSVASDYNDVYMQLLSGSPNLVFSRLNKTFIFANKYNQIDPNAEDVTQNPWPGTEIFYIFNLNQSMIDFYNARLGKQAADRYFTWDYELSPRSNYPLTFNVRYENVSGVRGLWMHQNIREVDETDSNVRYHMRGESGCLNDGSNVALGYMPSDESLVQIMNTRERGKYDEGVAVSGRDYQGIVLFDSSGNLVVAFDSQNGRDIDCEAVVYELPRKADLVDDGERRTYGLLTRIEAE